MEKALLSALVLAIAFTACKEPYSYTSPIDTNTIIDSSFRVGGVIDINAKVTGKYTLPISLSQLNGTSKNITLSIKGLPNNTTASFSKNVQNAPFLSNLSLTTDLPSVGVYPASIEAKAEGYAAQEFPININIEPFTVLECNEYFINSVRNSFNNPEQMTTYDSNGQILTITNCLISRSSNSNGQTYVYLRQILLNYGGINPDDNAYSFDDIIIEVNCNNNTLTIRNQEIRGYAKNVPIIDTFNVSGTGIIDIKNKQYIINYTADNNSYILRGSFRL